MKEQIKNIASQLGYKLSSSYEQKRKQLYAHVLEEIINTLPSKKTSDCSLIVFSKDRAMQLDALLRSYFQYVSHPVAVKVLYYASTSKMSEGYDKLISVYEKTDVEFIQENNFRKDLIAIFERLEVAKVFFLVDDLFFKSDVNLNEFIKINPKQYIASLRMGKHLNHSYTLNKSQALPDLKPASLNKEMMTWSFDKADLDWAYPLSVDGHLFDFEEMKVMVNQLDYKAPNSFEEALQLMNPLFKKRKGLCYTHSKIINNPCNKVQVENDNFSGNLTIEELNQKWLEGYRIHFEKHEGIENRSAHQELAIEFVKR